MNNIVVFNTTQFADQMENSYYLKEMLRNISELQHGETMAVWIYKKQFSKIRPIIYDLSSQSEMNRMNQLLGLEVT